MTWVMEHCDKKAWNIVKTRSCSIVKTGVREHVMTYVMSHCDENGMEHVMTRVRVHCADKCMENCDDKGHGAF